MNEQDLLTTWATGSSSTSSSWPWVGTGTGNVITNTPAYTTTSWVSGAPTAEQLKAYLGALVGQIEALQNKVKELEGRLDG